MTQHILIIGASSAIAQACARKWQSGSPARFFLVARDVGKLDQVGADLTARGAEATTHVMDCTVVVDHAAMLDHCWAVLQGRVDIVLIAHGTLPDQAACEADVQKALQAMSDNATSVIALLTLIANRMANQGQGVVAVISSVAGDRGRPSNYVYGTAKAAVSVFCEGLRARLFKYGVHVLTIKPGFVATPMTEGLPLPGPLVASADRVAGDIVHAVAHRRDVLYTPGFWRLIMLVIRLIPIRIFKRLSL